MDEKNDLPPLTVDMMNMALIPRSRELGYCICIHAFMTIIDFAGLSCAWCLQRIPENVLSAELKDERTNAIKKAFPEYVIG